MGRAREKRVGHMLRLSAAGGWARKQMRRVLATSPQPAAPRWRCASRHCRPPRSAATPAVAAIQQFLARRHFRGIGLAMRGDPHQALDSLSPMFPSQCPDIGCDFIRCACGSSTATLTRLRTTRHCYFSLVLSSACQRPAPRSIALIRAREGWPGCGGIGPRISG